MAVINKITIRDLINKGFPINRGRTYFPKEWLSRKSISLKELHKQLSKIKGSVAEEIAQMRDKEG